MTNRQDLSSYSVTLRALGAILCLVIPPISSAAVAQQGHPKPTNPTDKEPVTQQLDESAALRRRLAVDGFANRILAFQNLPLKVSALVRLADSVWRHDEVYARKLFDRALDLCVLKQDVSQREVQEIRSLRRKVIASIARRDPKLAEKLIRDDGLGDNIDDGNAATNIEVANSLVKTQPDKAVEFAERGLETGINTETVYFLLRLRRQSEPGADQLFANILARIAAQPFVDADTLLLLGTYVFTFPRSGSELRNLSSEGIRYVGVGPLLLVDISADRPNVSRSLVIGYLQVATEVVCRSVAQTQDRMKFYATGYLLLNKTERFTPELTPRIAMAMQALSQDVPNELKQESTYKNSEVRAPKDFDEITKELEKKEDVHYRDSLYLSLVSDLWQRSDYAKARIVNARISDMAVRDRLTSIIGFGEATTALKKGAVGEAEKMCVRLPQGIERALLRLGIAHMYADKGDLPRAAESINASLLDAAKLDDSRRPYLVLSAASQLVHVNAPAATATLLDAVRQFNALKDSTVDDNWDERVEVGMLWRDFPLEVEGVSHSFSQAMPDLMRADPDGTVGAVMGLTHEKHLSLALVEAAAVLLK